EIDDIEVLLGIHLLPVRPGTVRLLGPSLQVQPHVLGVGNGGILERGAIVGQDCRVVERPGDRHPAIPLPDLLERAALFLLLLVLGLGVFGGGTDQPALELPLLARPVRLRLAGDLGLALALLLALASPHAAHAAAAHSPAAATLGIAVALLPLRLI